MNKKNDTVFKSTPPTEKQMFEQYCQDMYMAMKDEVFHWEKRVTNVSQEEYISKNNSMLKKQFKRLNKKGNL